MSAVDYQQLIGSLFPAWGFEMGGIGWQLQQDNIMGNVWSHVARYVYAEGCIQFDYQIITKKQSAFIFISTSVYYVWNCIIIRCSLARFILNQFLNDLRIKVILIATIILIIIK